MTSVADRHSGRLGNRLAEFSRHRPVSVAVTLAPHVAHRGEAQHAIWMLINLLARAEGVVTMITLDCPDDTLLAPNVIPHLTGAGTPTAGADFKDSLLRAGNAIGVVPITARASAKLTPEDATADRHVTITDSPTATIDLAVYGRGWRAALQHDAPLEPQVTKHPQDQSVGDPDGTPLWSQLLTVPESPLPFGPYLAACLAASDVYLAVRMPPGQYEPARTYGWDCWTASPLTTGSQSGNATPNEIAAPAPEVTANLGGFALAGVGAVGAAWMHTLWACPGAHGDVPVVDADREGVSIDNLNRGVLFTRADIGKPKASAAAAAAPAGPAWRPSTGSFETSGHAPEVLVSAVDGNRARAALQNRYRPFMLSGSTRDLRAESLRIFPGSGACLRCHNEPPPELSDEQARAAGLADDTMLRAAAAATDFDPAELAAKLRRHDCDEVSERALARLRELSGVDVPEFSVGFVSVAAGVMLAAETVKVFLAATTTGQVDHDDPSARPPTSVVFQFWRPHAATNGSCYLGRDPGCPACGPDVPAFAVWSLRWQRWRDGRA